ncbi:5-oxoprolinase/urea amidolyase family protein [Streptomyces stelliscabiei]|uniref:Urea carboxylase n=2 Tax=Streptomyces stelliscabiei TaxID=146820 RepID=A0A8I0P5U6_9ACTN|nr:5-oxoprolinase/urea amidolyase family protein [Streptomyces stelliscabiei]KND43466.1 urea carboxylase [Streptomyces stelliscabiei]MBE1595848.1 urea carboxylase [Streptomyces stelliscabiei]MDX2517416.1 5-oxoprolinase/urea amidolyase family protein [Streptomyces stelliscabiei]MDX2555024.1 5-oxoprolinase/urea amidolyase family protein [Streptomyces stelliscabiei]MDX2617296.1 5-oxoprolinase/urea amidolyase family protein [Streptomyces stelliscabiei]
MTFDTLLVANRGEIAVRIIRTARALGLRTVAVYSDADRAAAHVRLADEAVRLGPAPAKESYLDADLILKAAKDTGAGAVHPGYGFLSEDAAFARRCEDADIVFVGPTPDQLELFGVKHTARQAAEAAGVPLLPGTDLLPSLAEALDRASAIGYPVMLKATGGGGGIGMSACRSAAELAEAWERVQRVAAASFSSAGVYLERLVDQARHVEVQVFGDGDGLVVTFGDRDCSLQRRNQKVVEEAPAPGLPDHVRARLAAAARDLCASVEYRSAGTVEFVYDAAREEAYFLEVNARLQVEHPVTEEIYGVDLVEWMLRLARGDSAVVRAPGQPRGHAVEARIYAEDPSREHRPSAGLLTRVEFPQDVRVDGWVETGTEVTTAYDPLLAKVVAYGSDRAHALHRLDEALAGTRVDGIETNLGLVRAALDDPDVRHATHSTATLATVTDPTPRIEVVSGGTLTTVQDWPGRTGHWQVGVPPCGPMDDLSFRLGNRALGNPEGAPGLECTLQGPALRFTHPTTVCVTGAPAQVTVAGAPVAQWEPVTVPAGAVLSVGAPTEHGLRTYVLFAGGGLDVPSFLGSAATFTLGRFGGHGGRELRTGDVLHGGDVTNEGLAVPPDTRPSFTTTWQVAALEGPHAAPEFFTEEDIHEFYAADWKVHFNSARTGVRLVGPKPRWARTDGGEAGLHPSNIHDTPYSVGAVDYTGDMPVLLGPDGPSLGGFVCPATVLSTERWKLGQLRPGDTVRFLPVADDTSPRPAIVDGGVLARDGDVTYRRSGDDNLLVEFGPMQLDLALRMRVHALMEAVAEAGLDGVTDLTPGIRSLQIQTNPRLLPQPELLAAVRRIVASLPPTDELVVPSRTIHLPLSWDDPATREAIARYMAGVRDDAPWCPWNIEFIRRVNGLDSPADVYDTVFAAEYLVLGLGDVYLGAPVATPLDPRHRLVTTKYNPARTWTAENSVGIGGAYLCIYGMEGPGGYQFVGRTTQVWSPWQQRGAFEPGSPWLLRFFDRIKWYPVEADELLSLRSDIVSGRFVPRVEDGTFSLAEYETFLSEHAESIAEFRAGQQAAFAAERAAWEAAGEFTRAEAAPAPPAAPAQIHVPEGGRLIEAEFTASVWQVNVRPGDRVTTGQPLLTLEAMKMESRVPAPTDGVIDQILTTPGTQVNAGTPLLILTPSPL